jgi:hypothetical protein
MKILILYESGIILTYFIHISSAFLKITITLADLTVHPYVWSKYCVSVIVLNGGNTNYFLVVTELTTSI